MRNEWIKIAVSALVLSTCAIANAEQIEFSVSEPIVTSSTIQSTTMADVLAGKIVPLSTRAKELDATWRVFSTNERSDNLAAAIQAYDGGASSALYSRGTTLSIGGENYLVAYRQKPFAFDPSFMESSDQNPMEVLLNAQLKPETVLHLTLLNLRLTSAFNTVQAFDTSMLNTQNMNAPFKESRQEAYAISSASNLRQLISGMMQWAQENDEKFPSMQSYATWKKAVEPYLQDDSLFIQPDTKKPYVLNPILSGKNLAHIPNLSGFAAIYEAQPRSNGKRAVAFVDGHVKRVTEAEWAKIKKVSGIK